jgi:phenylpyruvate tautomerase PptA (4-oxalocrotonate tautomerase family)
MPLAKIYFVEGRYDEARIAKVSGAVQAALMNTLRVPPEDFYQLIFELPKNRFLHTPSFVGMHYTDDLIILDVTFIQGRPKETRLALLKDINTRIAAAANVAPDDVLITLYEVPGENISFGQGEAQRANAVARAGGARVQGGQPRFTAAISRRTNTVPSPNYRTNLRFTEPAWPTMGSGLVSGVRRVANLQQVCSIDRAPS